MSGSKMSGAKRSGPNCQGVKRPGPKCQGAKRPGPKSQGAERPGPKSPGAKTLPEHSRHDCETYMIVTFPEASKLSFENDI